MSRVPKTLKAFLCEEIGRRTIEGLSPHTLRAMKDAVDSFLSSRPDLGGIDPAAVSTADVTAWVDGMRRRVLASSTLLVRFRYLSVLMKGLTDIGALSANPMKDLRAPRSRVAPVAFPDEAALERLLNPLRYPDMSGPRDLAIIWFLAAAGIRRAELIGMRWSENPEESDLELTLGRARVLGKGRRERQIPLMPGMVSVLEAYLKDRRRMRGAALPALWIGQRGALTTGSVNAIIGTRGRLAGIPHLHPHALRHAWAHRMLSSGVGEGDVMVLGGWSSRAMLSRYGAYAASERAFAAVESRLEVLEPWGRQAQVAVPAPPRKKSGGGRRVPSSSAHASQAVADLTPGPSAILPTRRRAGSVGA